MSKKKKSKHREGPQWSSADFFFNETSIAIKCQQIDKKKWGRWAWVIGNLTNNINGPSNLGEAVLIVPFHLMFKPKNRVYTTRFAWEIRQMWNHKQPLVGKHNY